MKKLLAFTLVELMVVMAIISFLSVGAYAGITYALRQGRNTQRIRIVDQIQTALTAHYADFQTYPRCDGTQVPGAPAGVFMCQNGYIVTSSGSNGNLLSRNSTKEPKDSGLKDLFDGDFNLGAFKEQDTVVYYYYASSANGKPSSFAICADLEGTRGGNTTKSSQAEVAGNTDCYCVGKDQSTLGCTGVTDQK